ncbi:hypothetical protein F3157_02130 [Virgibacillus dakarensis]|uniref:hypothetical protein n=1 Tax=Virgibacillus dakarensis TaxID=1917889 RepID=UPI000B432266|nr:hypothetical protein [Virgibacillus dakarensis]MTW84461.1 hypothetical protein [Virgibacillus dakarensis]
MVKLKKLTIGASTVILSSGLLFGCGAPNLDDEQEPDPTEKPSEQQDHNDNGSDINEDPAENEDIQYNQDQNGQDKNNQENNDNDDLGDILKPGHQ